MSKGLAVAIRSQFMRPRGFGGRLAGWEMALRSSNRKRNVWAVSLLDVQPSDRVLEIGFGPGIAIRELSRQASNGLVVGIDHSDVMLRQATRRNSDAIRRGSVHLRLGSADDLPVFDEAFDKMLAVNNFGMWRDPPAVLARLREILRPAGVIAIVSQPRCPGATAETTQQSARDVADRLSEAGFTLRRTEMLPLKPPVACVLAANSAAA